LQGVANLRDPMTRVAALDTPMQSVAASPAAQRDEVAFSSS
jgi:hypothetical protein